MPPRNRAYPITAAPSASPRAARSPMPRRPWLLRCCLFGSFELSSLAVTDRQLSLLDLARVHLDGSVEQLCCKRGFHSERLLHAEIGLHQFVILLHALGVDPAQRLGRRKIVGHQKLDALPLTLLVFLVETRHLVEQRLQAGADVGDASRKRLLADFHEILGQLWIFLEEGTVDDQRIAVGIETDVLPIDKPEVAAELDNLQIMLVVEIADDIDGVTFERRDLGGRSDIDKADRVG